MSNAQVNPPEKTAANFTENERKIYAEHKELFKTEANRIAKLAKILYEIKENKYYLIDGYKTFDAFCKSINFERTYCYRLNRFGSFLKQEGISEELAPAETAVRPILKNCFTGSESRIYSMAQTYARNKRKMKNIAEGLDENNGVDKIIPDVEDVRKAIRDFKMEENGTLYLSCLDVKIPVDTDFTKILEEYSEKIKNVHTLLNCLEQYKKSLPAADISHAKERIMKLITSFHQADNDKVEKLFSINHATDTENE